MIKTLYIKNYAIIEALDLEFSDNLNILTGETGSGKSIILGAFGLILGERADTKVLLNKKAKCVVEGQFDTGRFDLTDFFRREDLDYDKNIIIRREISAQGKSRAFVNDTPVNLKVLRQLTGHLVDLHQQFQNLGLSSPEEQMKIIDAVSGVRSQLLHYQKSYKELRALQKELSDLQSAQADAIRQRDFVEFQWKELVDQSLDPVNDADLERRLAKLENAQEIASRFGQVSFYLSEGDRNIISQIKELQRQLDSVISLDEEAEGISKRLESCYIELVDIADEAARNKEKPEFDDEEINQARQRLDKINALCHKHQVQGLDGLLTLQEDFEAQLNSFADLENQIEALAKQVQLAQDHCNQIAQQLHNQRESSIPEFERQVRQLLNELRMETAAFKIRFEQTKELNTSGRSNISFLFAPNKGSEFRAIKEVASGGELSRLALITKSLVAGSMDLSTLIFDEIDSGVSGDVAQKMGELLQRLATRHQVISITHSPQVAARATRHFKVYKQTKGVKTKAEISLLNREARITEIATMLSSSPPTSTALASARELMTDKGER